MKRLFGTCIGILCLFCALAQGGTLSLDECYKMAHEQNSVVKQAGNAVKISQYNLQAERQSMLPKVDVLANYSYLSRPFEVNLQTVKTGVIEGSSAQSVATANEVFKEITGHDLSQAAQDKIYNTSKGVISGIYPDYNPPLSDQQYFLAALSVRQPIYLGGKLNAARNIASSQYSASKTNLQVVQKDVDFLITLQYVRIMYQNTILQKEQRILKSLEQNLAYANEFVKNEILPPYQKNWASVALIQGQTRYDNLLLEKENAQLELARLIGLAGDTTVLVNDTFRYKNEIAIPIAEDDFVQNNPTFQSVQQKKEVAATGVKATQSLLLPNLFAVGAVNMYQTNLPIILPPWLIGVELQWNLFSGTQNYKRVKASKMLVEEARLAEDNMRSTLQTELVVAMNNIRAAQRQVTALDSARQQAKTTTGYIRDRMESRMSSPKDVNDALLIEEETEKAYATAILAYYLAQASYWHVMGAPQRMIDYLQ